PAEATAAPAAAPAGDIPALAQALFQWARQDASRKIIPSVERELVVEALKETKGNQVQAAKLLGITRATLRKRIAKFRIQQELAVG
ncbi:MAG TPA: helix-turn-helix domain-containing protein, partial [Verrucomicrobiae bacterium]